ncbi:T9SS type B sorting domain-containing protein [uncultured Nonlabens sp.]|uniref:T9SS type B sorting domain-containing protein n=1 Tax=uncultured Nonlabens sp. TaxID=859306 RepID=UPI0030D9C3D6
MKRFLLVLSFLVSYLSVAQVNINMIGSGPANPTRYTGCATSTFNDDGGNVNYSDNFNGVALFCPIIPTDRMILDFVVMDLELNDVLTIYDGDSTAAPLLATITNTNVPPGVFQASAGNPSGCLTVQFISNGSGNASGWRAARRCFDPCQSIVTNITTTPPIDTDGILRVCQGDTVTFDGQATFGVDGVGATYEWDLANGAGFNSGQVQTETYSMTGIYQTKFRVTDAAGCSDRDEIDLVVQVSSDPDFTGTMAADTQLCFGESTTLTGVATTQEFLIPVSPPVTGQTFLPDGSGVSYTTCIDVDLFAPGTVITSASDIVNIFLNMEHSYLGDLQLTITAPNGSEVDLHQYSSGGGAFLGIPIDDDANRNPGAGFDYVFTETATQTWTQYVTANPGGTIPAGDYLPVDPYSTFIGSPINGQWCITITDNLGSDNGYIFFWGLNFNPAIIPADLSFTPVIVTEAWQASPDITSTVGNTVTITPSIAGSNCYTYEMTDNHGCTYTEQVCIDVAPEILAAAPNDIILCNTTGTTTVDLTQNDAVILNGLPAGDHVVTYHTSQTDAENGVGAIGNPTAYPISMPPMTVFSAITNTTSNCILVDSFVVDVIDFSTFVIPDFEQCGPIANFDLDAYVSAAIGSGGSGGSNFTTTYYTSLMDAQNETNPILNPTSFDLAVGTVTIYVRIVSTADTSCSSINPFSLTAAPIPVANTPMDMVTCDDLSNDGTEVFVLSDQNAAILNGQTATVTYHLTQLDAINGAAPLNAAAYSNTASPQTIYARVTDNSTLMCSSTTMFDLVVNRIAVFTGANDIVVCDDISNDGFDVFDLTSQNPSVLGAQLATDNTITFYNSPTDAAAGINAIVNPSTYTNTTTGTETVFVRIENSTATDCYDSGSFDLIINATPIANPVAEVIVCDDPSNDEQDVFTFSSYSSQVLLAQDPLLYAISYHDSQANADAGTNTLDTTSYTNTSNPQTIYVRIENVNNMSCFNTTTFDLTINETPAITTAPDLTLCDDPSGDGAESFDLTQNDAIILNGLNPADYTIVYSNATGVITSPYSNTSSPEAISIRVENNTTNCSDTTTFDLIVSPVPASVPSFTMEECDEDGDGVASFTLGDANTQVINGQTGTTVSYYDSTADALSGSNPLDTASYDNTIAPQTIYYRLEFTSSACFSIGDFVIEPVDAPIAVTPTALEACDDGSGNATIDVSLADAQVTTGQAGSTVVYYLNQTDADSQVNGITNDFTYSSNTTLIVRVDDDNTNCFSFTTLDLVFHGLPTPSLLDQYILCLDENNNLVNGPVTLDTGLNDTEYSYEWTLNGALLLVSTASIDVAEGGDYQLTATRIATGCSISITTNVRVSSVPEVYDIDITTDPFDKDHQVIVRAQGPDQYWYRLDDGPYVNNGTFNDVTPGAHTVTIAERSGCGEIVVDIFVFGYPDYFTPNADGIHDTWNIIGGDRLPGTRLYIFDRYGKLIKQLDVDGPGWDGTYNGQALPSSDYWFRIEYAFDGQQREASGHFAMKR